MQIRQSDQILLLVATLITPGLLAQTHRRERQASASNRAQTENCYDPSDPQDGRLWSGRAPGANGDDPCKDIAYLRVFHAPSESPSPRPAIIVIGGGGYDHLTDTKEQAPVAEYFSRTMGLEAFVLYYRLVQPDGTYRYPVPMWDGQLAIKLIRSRAIQMNIDPARVAVFGFSAGGHLASTLALHPASDFHLPSHDSVDSQIARPDLLGLGYPVISMDPTDVPPSGSYRNLLRGFEGAQLQYLETYLSGEKNVTDHTPPIFLFESMDDARISPQNSVLFATALRNKSISAEIHLFPHGEHGAGLAQGIPGEQEWPEMYHRWLKAQGFLR
jgi:acetyl esterase/lipase